MTEQRQRNYADINFCPWKDYFLVYSPGLRKSISYSMLWLWVHSETPGPMVYFWKWKYTSNFLGTVINRIIMKTCTFLGQETGNFNHSTRIKQYDTIYKLMHTRIEFIRDWVKMRKFYIYLLLINTVGSGKLAREFFSFLLL